MRLQQLIIALLFLAWANIAAALELIVSAPYIELHTGPGIGYPVHYVVRRGEIVELYKSHTGWYKVRYKDKKGWISRPTLAGLQDGQGEPAGLENPGREAFKKRRFELGVGYGEFAGTSMISASVDWFFTRNFAVELGYDEVIGDFYSQRIYGLAVQHQWFPKWRATPYFSIGTGLIETDARSTLVAVEDTLDEIVHAGGGIRVYLTGQFILRLDYKSQVVFTSREQNEEPESWKIGFSAFF